jgi:hypothetical protein
MDNDTTLTQKLSQTLTAQIEGPLGELEQKSQQLQEQVTAGIADLQERLKAVLGGSWRQALVTSVVQIAAEAVQTAENRRQEDFSALAEASRKILSAQSQAAILSGLVDAAQRFAGRIVLFISRGEFLLAWESRGLDSPETFSALRTAQIPKKSDTVLAAAYREMKRVEGTATSHRENAQLLERLGKPAPERITCVPVVVRGQATAVLYADAASSSPTALQSEALMLLVELGQMQIELKTLESKLGLKPRVVEAVPQLIPRPMAPAAKAGFGAGTLPAVPETKEVPPPPPEPIVKSVEPLPEPTPVPIAQPQVLPAQAPVISVHPPHQIKPVPMPPKPAIVQPPPAEERIEETQSTTRLDIADIPLFGTSPTPPPEPAGIPGPSIPPPAIATPAIHGFQAEPDLSLAAESEKAEAEEEAIEIDLDTIFAEGSDKDEEAEVEDAGLRFAGSPKTAVTESPIISRMPEPLPTVPIEAEEVKQDTMRFISPTIAAPAPPPVVEVPPSPEVEKMHSDAKRFARLLVSEIKLYNEQMVIEGRKHQDIYSRLKKDIDRSRELYQKRVAEIVSHKADYFHDELVRILGANDPTTLGVDYPGPRISSVH